MNDKIVWELFPQDAQVIINILGEVPSKSGIWPLIANLDEQTKKQLKPSGDPNGGSA